MKFFPSRFASSIVLSLSFASIAGSGVGCGDDESTGTGGAGGDTAASTSSGATTSTNQSSSSSAGQGGEAAGTGGETGSGGNGTGGDGTGGNGTGGDGAGGKGEGGEGGGSALCLPTATTVDLLDVVERAKLVAEDIYDQDLGEPTIWFQEGVNAVGFPAPNDMGAIVVAFDTPEELAVVKDQRIVYRASIWGIEDVWIARVIPWEGITWDVDPPAGDDYFQYYTTSSGLGTLAGEISEEAGEAFKADFEDAFPGSTFIVFANLGVFTFTGVDPTELAAAFAFLETRDEVDIVEPDGEVYATDFGFGPRVDLSSQLDDGPIDVYEEHAFLSHWLRDGGIVTYNLPTLPEPFGPGPVAQSPEQRYTIGFAEGTDVDACLEELAGCSFASEVEDDVTYLIDPSYLGASALRHECLEYLIPTGGGPV